MEIKYSSDLYPKFPVNALFLKKLHLSDENSVLILAGDIAYLDKNMVWKHPFFDWCSDLFDQTLIIPGNRELFRDYTVENTLEGLEQFIRPNVRYINKKSFDTNDVETFCTTLWSAVDQLATETVRSGKSDFQRIKYNGHDLTEDDYERLCNVCLDWVHKALDDSAGEHKDHYPTHKDLYADYPRTLLRTVFLANMDNFIRRHFGVEYWIIGHTHFNNIPQGEVVRFDNAKNLCNQKDFVEVHEMANFSLDTVIHFEKE